MHQEKYFLWNFVFRVVVAAAAGGEGRNMEVDITLEVTALIY